MVYLEDVTNRIPQELRDDIIDSCKASATVGDKWYGTPMFSSFYLLTYNKDILNQAGYDKPPETWDEFFKCAEAVTIDEGDDGIIDVYGLTSQLVEQWGFKEEFQTILKSVGGEFWNEDRNNPQPLFNNEQGIRALQIFKKINASKFTDPAIASGDDMAVRMSMASRKAAIGIVCGFEAQVKENFPENIDIFGYSLWPHDPGFDSYAFDGTVGWGIRKGGNVDNALAFCLYTISPEIQKFYTKTWGTPSARISFLQDEEYIEEFPYTMANFEQAKHSQYDYLEKNSSVIESAFFPIFQSLIIGDINEETAISELEEAFNNAWKE